MHTGPILPEGPSRFSPTVHMTLRWFAANAPGNSNDGPAEWPLAEDETRHPFALWTPDTPKPMGEATAIAREQRERLQSQGARDGYFFGPLTAVIRAERYDGSMVPRRIFYAPLDFASFVADLGGQPAHIDEHFGSGLPPGVRFGLDFDAKRPLRQLSDDLLDALYLALGGAVAAACNEFLPPGRARLVFSRDSLDGDVHILNGSRLQRRGDDEDGEDGEDGEKDHVAKVSMHVVVGPARPTPEAPLPLLASNLQGRTIALRVKELLEDHLVVELGWARETAEAWSASIDMDIYNTSHTLRSVGSGRDGYMAYPLYLQPPPGLQFKNGGRDRWRRDRMRPHLWLTAVPMDPALVMHYNVVAPEGRSRPVSLGGKKGGGSRKALPQNEDFQQIVEELCEVLDPRRPHGQIRWTSLPPLHGEVQGSVVAAPQEFHLCPGRRHTNNRAYFVISPEQSITWRCYDRDCCREVRQVAMWDNTARRWIILGE